MDKRSFSLVVSPKKLPEMNISKKLKISLSPNIKINENNVNALNLNLSSEINDELNGLCFDDDDDEEFYNKVSLYKLFITL